MAGTNLPRLRHSIVDQIVSAYLDRIGQRRPVRPFERMAINAFGATDHLAVKLMTPEIVFWQMNARLGLRAHAK